MFSSSNSVRGCSMKIRGFATAAVVGCFSLVTSTTVLASELDLTNGGTGTFNGALFQWTNTQPTGTGVIDSIVRIQANGMEEGYNTSGRPVAFDEKTDPNFTRNLQLFELAKFNIGGTLFYRFLLDIDEGGQGQGQNINQSLLSLDMLQIYTSSQGSKNTTDLGMLGTLRYNMGAGNLIQLDGALSGGGSGKGDMLAYIPVANFAGANGSDFMYLYSKFGVSKAAGAGPEEWAASLIPEPGTYAMVLGGLLALAIVRKRRS